MYFSRALSFSSVTRGNGRYMWMWNFLPNFFFRAFAAERVLSKYISGSPPVIPAPLAFDSIASFTMSEFVLQGRSLAHIVSEFFRPSLREQYQQFREHFPPTKRTSFWPLRHSWQPLQGDLVVR